MMTKEQKETIKILQDAEFHPTWGFDGACIKDLPNIEENIDENDVNFTLYIYSPCFDCEQDCDGSRHDDCDSEETYRITPDGLINGEFDVNYFLDNIC